MSKLIKNESKVISTFLKSQYIGAIVNRDDRFNKVSMYDKWVWSGKDKKKGL